MTQQQKNEKSVINDLVFWKKSDRLDSVFSPKSQILRFLLLMKYNVVLDIFNKNMIVFYGET